MSKRIELQDGSWIEYVYDASGVKLQTLYNDGWETSVKDYVGNLVVQATNYYPFGLSMAENPQRNDQEVQAFKYNGKELDRENQFDTYDYGARMYAPAIGRFMTMDPMAEKYYSISPYAYCGNNPVNRIDPNGMDWYINNDGTYQYNPDLNKDNQAEILKKGQTYVGATYQVKDKNGNVTEDYRNDGSIMFSSEKKAYKRMVSNTQKTGKEEMGVITDNGVLVVPNYKNTETRVDLSKYEYSVKNGNVIDKEGTVFKTVATAHTHPSGGDMSGDVTFARLSTPLKSVFALSTGGENAGNINYIIHSGERGNFMHVDATFQNPNNTVSNVLSGNLSLRSFSKSIVRKHMRTGVFKAYP